MSDAIDLIIKPRWKDLGGFSVRRALPYAKRRSVGPFVFWDEMGPADFAPGQGIDVRPHPHIGLATVTYLFDGEITHHDSLGYKQSILPGDVNWMTAGRGISHSERTGDGPRAAGQKLHGIQSWVALPQSDEETDPSFFHHPGATLPAMERDGVAMRLITGSAYGETSPVEVFSPMFYVAAEMAAGADLAMTDEYAERALYAIDDGLSIDGQALDNGDLVVLKPGGTPLITAASPARVMLFGGDPLDGPRHMYWNYVSSRPERIEQAKQDWITSEKAGWTGDAPFTLPPGETEFIPLPE